mgnify:FL=1
MRLPRRDFVGATAVVTGAASGMGEAMAHELATEGADVLVLVDWHAERLGLVATAIRDRAPDVKVDTHVVDLGNRADLDALVADLGRAHDHIDLLVNNAGVALFGRFAQMTIADFEWVTDINLRAPIVLTHGLLPNLLRADGAHVINTSSLFGLIAPPGQSAYCASKFGLRGFSESLGAELEDDGVGVTTVHPGGIRTRIATSARAAASVAAGDVESSLAFADKALRMPPERAARIILDAASRRIREALL